MNKRLRQFEKESKLEIFGLGAKRHIWEAALEKYAELIVRECIRELEISRKCDPYTGELFDCEYNTCIKEQSVMLKEHFGVEE